MIVKLDKTELNCQTVIKAYDMRNGRFNVVLTIDESNPDDDMYIKLLKNSHMLTMIIDGNPKDYSIINSDIMYNVRYDNDNTALVTISIPVKEK